MQLSIKKRHASACHTRAFFFNDTATTEIYTLSLHDALPILARQPGRWWPECHPPPDRGAAAAARSGGRSEEHTSELQSHHDLVCRRLLEKKNDARRRRSPPT